MKKIILISVGVLLAGVSLWQAWERPRAPVPEITTLLKIGFSTDWEYGSRKQLEHKLPAQGITELEKVVAHYNDVFHPDIVVAGGDYIESSSTKPEKAKAQLREVAAVFQKLTAPRLYALGNHDMRSLSKGEVREILGMNENHAVQDMGDWRLVVFDTNFNKEDDTDRRAKNYVVGYVSQTELAWLDQAITTDRPTIVFSHHSPIDTLSQTSEEKGRNITNAEAVQALLEKHLNVVASVAGHTPRPQYKEVNGVHYFVTDTLVNETGLGAFATIEAKFTIPARKAEILFEHYGLHRETYRASKILDRP